MYGCIGEQQVPECLKAKHMKVAVAISQVNQPKENIFALNFLIATPAKADNLKKFELQMCKKQPSALYLTLPDNLA
jgi:hypothetical protein